MRKLRPYVICLALLSGGCAPSGPPDKVLSSEQATLSLRQLQTRRFDDSDEAKILVAGAGVLQDLGFTLEESETKLGVIVASKNRDATDGGQIAGQIALAILLGVQTSVDKEQKIRVSLVSNVVNEKSTNVRVTFQRIVWNDQGKISRVESIEDAEIYQEFFDKLSKAVFLTANAI